MTIHDLCFTLFCNPLVHILQITEKKPLPFLFLNSHLRNSFARVYVYYSFFLFFKEKFCTCELPYRTLLKILWMFVEPYENFSKNKNIFCKTLIFCQKKSTVFKKCSCKCENKIVWIFWKEGFYVNFCKKVDWKGPLYFCQQLLA